MGANLRHHSKQVKRITMTGTTNNLSQKVTVIGLGSMGTALARSFLTKGFQVTVWNRDPSKAIHLMEKGAQLAPNVTAAIEASPLLVICVSDYKATKKIFGTGEAATALQDRVL